MDPILTLSELPNSAVVVRREGGWYWNDESGNFYGPYLSEEDAQAGQDLYCATELAGIRVMVSRKEWDLFRTCLYEPACDQYRPGECLCLGRCGCHFQS